MKKTSYRKAALWVFFFLFLGAGIFFIVKGKFPSEEFWKDKRLTIDHIIKYFPFTKENSLKEWEEKVLKGRVVYLIEKGEELSYVRAKSQKAASALYHKVNLDIARHPVLSWRWRVDRFPERGLPETIIDKEEEDFAARVYVIFPAPFFTKSKVIEYIWSETLPEGTRGRSGYSKNIMVLVLKKGKSLEWHSEKRNIYSDYTELFGEEPRMNIGAIAFMTDADSTKTSAEAVYDEIRIGYE